MIPGPKRVEFEDGTHVTVQWNVRLGRLSEGYARAGDHVKGQIRIGRGLTQRMARGTLVHEIGHEAWDKAALDDHLGSKTEELVMDSLIPHLLETLDRNPHLRDWLWPDDFVAS